MLALLGAETGPLLSGRGDVLSGILDDKETPNMSTTVNTTSNKENILDTSTIFSTLFFFGLVLFIFSKKFRNCFCSLLLFFPAVLSPFRNLWTHVHCRCGSRLAARRRWHCLTVCRKSGREGGAPCRWLWYMPLLLSGFGGGFWEGEMND